MNFVDLIKKYAYLILGLVCILVVGVLYLVSMNRDAVIMSPGQVAGNNDISDITIVQAGNEIHDAPAAEAPTAAEPSAPIEPEMIMVHILGAVNNPGIFELPLGSRVNHAVILAGGFTEDADEMRVNLAAFLVDTMQIIVPAVGDDESIPVLNPDSPAAPGGSGASGGSAPGIINGLVNINTASYTELQTLPNIGSTIAQNIIDFREANGRFSSIDELIHVTRIGAATLDGLRNMVTVG